MKKKIVAFVMTLCMVVMLVPHMVFAAETYQVNIRFAEPYIDQKPEFSPMSIMTDWSYSDEVTVDTSYNSNSYQGGVRWLREADSHYMSANDVFEQNKEYILSVRLVSSQDKELSSDTSFYVNDYTDTTVQIINSHTAVVEYRFLPKELQKPTISSQTWNRNDVEGNSVRFEVQASGGGLTYQWQVSKDNGSTWSNVNATKYPSAKTPVLQFVITYSLNGFMYRCEVTNSKGSVTSSPAKLTVFRRIDTASVTITEPTPGAHPDYAPTVPSGAFYSIYVPDAGYSSVFWRDVTNDNQDLTETDTFIEGHTYRVDIYLDTQDGYAFPQDAIATVNGREPVYFGAVDIVYVIAQTFVCSNVTKPTITTQPSNKTVAVGATATFKVVASGDNLTYKWQVSKDNGSTWTDVNQTKYPSAATATFSFKTTATLNGYKYRCVVSNAGGSVNSSAAKLTVNSTAKPTITTQPSNKTVAVGATATFKVVASGDDLTYKWQVSKDNGSTWTDVNQTKYPSAATATFSFKTTATLNGYKYRCVVSNAGGSVNSSAATLTVTSGTTKPTITTQPSSKTTTLGTSVTFKVVASGATSYQWEYSKDNGATWTKWSGKTSASVKVTASTTNNGCLYRCKVTNSAGTVTSSKAKLTVSDIKPTITGKPSAVTVSAGGTAKFTVVAAGSGLTYKWQVSKDGGTTWTNINQTKYPSAATATLSFKATATTNGYMYRCVVSNSYGSVKTTGVKLTVN